MKRVPLPCNYPITMSNGGKYYIDELVGEGGFSLVYNAHTEGGKAKVVLKEFFPTEYACRDLEPSSPTYNKVIPISDEYRELFRKNKNMFNESEGKFGGELLLESSQVVAFSQSGDGYAVLPRFSKDMYTILDLVQHWENNPLKEGSAGSEDITRIAYSLKIVDSILDVVSISHSNEIIHLDLSATNIVFATKDINDERNGRAYLIDFGSAVKMHNGRYIPNGRVSYSEGYSAPEVMNYAPLTEKTDIYSIGAILYFLCVGKKATIDWRLQKIIPRDIEYEIENLKIPTQIKEWLICILKKSCISNVDNRYESAIKMQKEIRIALEKVQENKFPHIYLSNVKPITESFVRYSKNIMEQIESVLDEHNMCFVYGMSGVGKSELMRQFAEEKCRDISVLEIYFPEQSVDYTMDQVVSSLTYVNLQEKDSLKEKKDILQNFLEKEVVLLLHNFNCLDTSFLQENFKRKNIKLLISTQSTSEDLEIKNIQKECMIEVATNAELGTQIFKKVFVQHHKRLPGTEDEIAKLSHLLFDLPILVNLVATQLTQKREDRFFWLLKQLEDKSIDKVLDGSLKYKKDYFAEKIEGSPFTIVHQIILATLPSLTAIEEQCLQIISKMPGQWIPSGELEQIIGDLPYTPGFDLAYDAITNLIDAHLLQTKYHNNTRYISIHALMAIIVSSNAGDKSYIKEASLEFWQHLERNAFVDFFDINKRQDTIPLHGDYFKYNKILGPIRYFCEKNILKSNFDSITKTAHNVKDCGWEISMKIFDLTTRAKEQFINDSYTITFNELNINLIYEYVLIYCEYGIILLKQLEEFESKKNANSKLFSAGKFKVIIDASKQNLQRYYIHKDGNTGTHDEFLNKNWGKSIHAVSCAVLCKSNKYTIETVVIPNDFASIPITNVEYTEENHWNYSALHNLVLPKECICFRGKSDRVKSVLINSKLEQFDFLSKNIRELNIPARVNHIAERSITTFIDNMNVDLNNETYIKIDEIVYTKDMKRIIFIAPQKRLLSISIPESVKEINLLCMGYKNKEFSVYDMPFYHLAWLLARKDKLSTFEKTIFTMVNKSSMEIIFYTIGKILNFYEDYVKNETVPFYFPFYYCYNSLNPRDMDTNEKITLSVSEAIASIEYWIARLSRSKEEPWIARKNVNENIYNINIDNFISICRLFLEEDVRYINLIVLLSKNIFLYDSLLIAKGIDIIKEKKQCSTLHQVLNSSEEEISIFEEIISICNSIASKKE